MVILRGIGQVLLVEKDERVNFVLLGNIAERAIPKWV